MFMGVHICIVLAVVHTIVMFAATKFLNCGVVSVGACRMSNVQCVVVVVSVVVGDFFQGS